MTKQWVVSATQHFNELLQQEFTTWNFWEETSPSLTNLKVPAYVVPHLQAVSAWVDLHMGRGGEGDYPEVTDERLEEGVLYFDERGQLVVGKDDDEEADGASWADAIEEWSQQML